jgi:hypothetical protein
MPLPLILAGAAIAAAGFGAKKGYDGYQDKSEANDIIEAAKRKYDKDKKNYDEHNENTNLSLTKLGELQLNIGEKFLEFRNIAEKLLEKLSQSNSKSLEIDFPQHKLDKIDGLALSTTAYIGKVAGASVTGAAAAYAVYGGVMAVAAASTGTPIAALSGAAAYNATMAAIGGGSIAAGGFGMAGGAMVLGGVVAAPIIAVAGFAYASHAEKALSDAQKTRIEVNEAVVKFEKACKKLSKTQLYVDKVYVETDRLYNIFKEYFDILKSYSKKIEEKSNVYDFEDDVVRVIQNGYKIAAILTDVITTPLFKPKKDEKGNVIINNEKVVEIEIDSDGMQVINELEIDAVLSSSGVHK